MSELNAAQKRIRALAAEKNAVILAHNYQIGEIQDLADFVGDSLELAIKAKETDAEIIVFCGVHFMAETAKLLNPSKKVLLPSLQAGCFMADMITPERLREKKAEYPEAAVVTYVNSTAATKAESDICVTSANAVAVVASLPQKQILFTPDEHLGTWVGEQLPDKEIIPWQGFCHVHTRVTPERLALAKEKHPAAEIVAHPECPKQIRDLADHVCGTGGMIRYCRASAATEFLIVTEAGMCHRLSREIPDKKFWPVCGECINMKQINLENLLEALEKEQFEITVPEEIAGKAKAAIDKMLEVK
jgi:quinolinate synthase